jgi:uncharacterized repeat protein (TIGR01451 family)
VGTLACTTSSVAAANASLPAITVTVNVATDAASSLTNVAMVSGGGDNYAANNTASDVTTIASLPVDLTIAKSHTGLFTRGQTGAIYTIVVANAGTARSSGAITVTETPPPGMTVTNLSGASWACNVGALNCTFTGGINPGSQAPPLTVTVSLDANIAANINNTATVSGGGDSNLSNNTAVDPTAIGQPDVAIRKYHTGDFQPGQQNVAWLIEVSNAGTSPAIGTIVVTEQPPAEFTVTQILDSAVAGQASCSLATLSCTLTEPLAAGQSRTIRVLGNVSGTATAAITNRATVTVTGGQEGNTANNTAADTATLLRTDLALAIARRGNFRQASANGPAQTGTFDVTVSNPGNQPARGTVRFTYPAGLGISAFTPVSGNWRCGNPLLAPLNDTLFCELLSDLQPGATAVFTASIPLSFTAPPAVTLQGSLSVSGDSNPANNSAQDTATVDPAPAELRLTLSDSGTWYQNTAGTMNLTLGNYGHVATSGLLTVSLGATGASITALSGSGWTCNPGTLSCTRPDPLGVYGSNSSTFPNIVINITPGAQSTQMTVTAAVTGGGAPPANTQAQRNVTPRSPDLTINKTANGATFTSGQNGSYTITVTNSGQTPSFGAVTVTELPPAGMTVTAMSGSGWLCSVATLSCTRSDALAGGALYPSITVSVSVAATASGTLSNTAVVSGGGDASPLNNTSTAPTRIVQASYNVALTIGAATFNRATGRYTITVSIANSGAAVTASALALDNLTPGVTLVNASGVTSASAPAGSPYIETGAIGAGAVVNANLVFTRAPGAGPITFAARFLGPEPR